jgi:hypothetical protein
MSRELHVPAALTPEERVPCTNSTSTNNLFLLTLQPPWALVSDFQFHDHFTDGRTHWTSDQLVANITNTE